MSSGAHIFTVAMLAFAGDAAASAKVAPNILIMLTDDQVRRALMLN